MWKLVVAGTAALGLLTACENLTKTPSEIEADRQARNEPSSRSGEADAVAERATDSTNYLGTVVRARERATRRLDAVDRERRSQNAEERNFETRRGRPLADEP